MKKKYFSILAAVAIAVSSITYSVSADSSDIIGNDRSIKQKICLEEYEDLLLSLYSEESKDVDYPDEYGGIYYDNIAFAASDAFSQYSFIYDLVDELTDYMKNNTGKVDIISVGDQLDLKAPENSKVKVIVGDEESAEKVEKYVCSLGYEKEILNIVIDSNFRPVPDAGDNSEKITFNDYEFVYEILNVVTELMNNNKDVDIRSAGDKLDLETPENSKVEVRVGSVESAQTVKEYVINRGYSENSLSVIVDPAFQPVPDGNAVCFGDLNSDQTIDVTDLTELSLALLGDKELTEDQQKAADIDGDGSVTLADLARLQQYLSKKIDKL